MNLLVIRCQKSVDERLKGRSKFGVRYGGDRRCSNTLRYHSPEQCRSTPTTNSIKLTFLEDDRMLRRNSGVNRRYVELYLPGQDDGPVLTVTKSLEYSINKKYR